MPDLVEERERAGVALQGVAQEVTEGDLDLPLRRCGEPESRQRLDVLALVRLQELERIEREARSVVRRAWAAVAQDATQRRDPAVPGVDLQDPIAFDAAIDLRPHAELVGEMHLVPAGDAT